MAEPVYDPVPALKHCAAERTAKYAVFTAELATKTTLSLSYLSEEEGEMTTTSLTLLNEICGANRRPALSHKTQPQ